MLAHDGWVIFGTVFQWVEFINRKVSTFNFFSPTAEWCRVFAQYRFRCVLGELGRPLEGTGFREPVPECICVKEKVKPPCCWGYHLRLFSLIFFGSPLVEFITPRMIALRACVAPKPSTMALLIPMRRSPVGQKGVLAVEFVCWLNDWSTVHPHPNVPTLRNTGFKKALLRKTMVFVRP